MERVRYLRGIHRQYSRVPPGQRVLKPKKIDGVWWLVDCWRDEEGRIRYKRRHVILPDFLEELARIKAITGYPAMSKRRTGWVCRDVVVKRKGKEFFVHQAWVDDGSEITFFPKEVARELRIRLERSRRKVAEFRGQGILLYGPYKASVTVDGFTAKAINVFFEELGRRSVVGLNFLKISGYKIKQEEKIPSEKTYLVDYPLK